FARGPRGYDSGSSADGVLGRLDDDESGPVEGELDGFTGSAAEERADVDIGLDLRSQSGRPAYGSLRVDEGRLLRAVENHGVSLAADGRSALTREVEVEDARTADHGADPARDAFDLPAQRIIEGQKMRGVARQRVLRTLQGHHEDIRGFASEEHLAMTLNAHHIAALAGGSLLHELSDGCRPLVGEVHIPLVGDHGS